MDSPVRPAPRLIARSMLSLGTEVFLAFCTASTSVGLPERSAPPVLAATSMFLMSLANDLARRASMTAFLCLVVAHLECPDTGAPSSYVSNLFIVIEPPPSAAQEDTASGVEAFEHLRCGDRIGRRLPDPGGIVEDQPPAGVDRVHQHQVTAAALVRAL